MTPKPQYATRTTVPPERSRAEIESLLRKYGASAFAYAWEGANEMITFKLDRRTIRIILPAPERLPRVTDAAYKQFVWTRWRGLVLVIKAKLEGVALGITTMEREFLADLLLPNGATIGQWAAPQIERIYEQGTMPPLLTGGDE